MPDNEFAREIKKFVDDEIALASDRLKKDDTAAAFRHLERAHVFGQAITYEHTRVHWLMLKVGLKTKNFREIFRQVFRIVGASTKTPFGIYPAGNTGGANVSPFKPIPVPVDLQAILDRAKDVKK